VWRAEGEWLVVSAGELDRRLRAMEVPQGRHVRVDLSRVERLDSTGAWLLLRTEHELSAHGNDVELANLSPRFAPLLDQVRAGGVVEPLPHPVPPHHTFVGFIERVGRITTELLSRLYDILGFTGLVTVTLLRLLREPRRLRLTATLVQMEVVGLDALPIVGLLSFLIGVVFAYQGSGQLRRFGAEVFTVNLLGVGVLRELGGLMAAIIVAGRSGSAFTAQIGTMKVSEELDAIQVSGLNTIEVLVLPRLLGIMLTLPLLTFYSNAMGIAGGAAMCYFDLGITIPAFLHELRASITGWTFWVGLIKAPVFAFIIALVGCHQGFQVERNAASVGRHTTQAVVEAIFLVIVADAAFSVTFSRLGI